MNLKNLPKSPGCYLYKDKKGDVIYVGKAGNLKKRISQYFQKKDSDPKTKMLLKNINSVETIITDNEVEALILENQLIKKNQPKYNVRLKDSKTYSYIRLTKEDFPRILISRDQNEGKNYGPFTNASERDLILKLLKKTFKLRTCSKIRKTPCLRYHLNHCLAPCSNNISKKEYEEIIKKSEMVLLGRTNELIIRLENEMKSQSLKNEFEKAIIIRDQINALNYLKEHQKIERIKKYDEDIINYLIKNNEVYLMVFNIYKGTLFNKKEFIFNYSPNFLEEFIIQYYSESKIPKEIILNQKIEKPLQKYLTKHAGKNIIITNPKRGEKKQLLDMVYKNIINTFFSNDSRLNDLKEKLRLTDLPEIIECFDISHLSGTMTVGSMVQFKYGKPNKSSYRRFRIRTVSGIDDVKSIAEIVKRRYSRLKNEKQKMPDLIIIDGGRAQLNSALNELRTLELQIPVISIAKRFEEIYLPYKKKPLRMNNKQDALKLVQQIRDEAHRFAINYNKLLRKKEFIK